MIYRLFHNPGLGLFLVRFMLGIIFTAHGAQKLFGAFGGPGLHGFVQWSSSSGIPEMLAYLAPFFEFIGGVMLLFGIAPQIGALLEIPIMLGAIFFVHLPHGFFAQNNGFEYPLALLIFLLAVIVGGPSSFAIWQPNIAHYLKNR